MASFYRNFRLSHNSVDKLHKEHEHFDFISSLALAQERNLDLLPIKWRPGMDDDPSNILRGGTAKINQLHVTISMSMVFKVVKLYDKFRRFDCKETYRALCYEIAILTSPRIRGHHNIVQLEGLSWDIQSERILPVLLFEKASCGDAAKFFDSEENRRISFDEKLKLCTGIGQALLLLHSCRIVHGDIKPENVLIDRDTAGCLNAKLADFGYSSLYSKGQFHQLPESRPWNAPETSTFEVSFDDAVSTDVYSYAMTCFWILFQTGTVSGTHLLLKRARTDNSAVEAIQRLKNENHLKEIICRMIAHEDLFTPSQKQGLTKFFEQTLVRVDETSPNHTTRETNLLPLLGFLGDNSITEPEHFEENASIPESDFQLGISLLQISRLDYRIRQFMVSELRKGAEGHDCAVCRENAAYQLSLCYRLGFGIERDLLQSSYWLSKSDRDGSFEDVLERCSFSLEEQPNFHFDDLERQKPFIDVEVMFTKFLGTDDPYHNPKMRALYNDFSFTSIDHVNEYRATGFSFLDKACKAYRREASDIQEELGHDHEVLFVIRNILARILKGTGQLEDALKLGLELYELMRASANFGPEHEGTAIQANFVAEIYQEQGNFEASRLLLQKILEIQQRTMALDDLHLLLTLNNLGETLYDQGEYEMAEECASKALSGRLKALGEQNVDTLISMNNLGTNMIAQDRLEEAEEMLSRAEMVATKILGPTDFYTLTVVNNLGATLHFQDKFAEARSKMETSLENCRAALGPSHPATSTSMLNLANLFISMEDYDDARDLCRTAAANLEEKLGRNHPSTLEAKSSMIRVAEGDNDYQLAETLARDLFEVSKQVLGETHMETLNRADALASMLMNNGKDAEAGDLYQWAMEKKEIHLGKDNPQTLLTIHNLGNIRYIEGRYEEARQLLTRAYEGLVLSRGPQHSSTLMSFGKLASAYGGLKDFETAERMAREVISGFKELDRRRHEEEYGSGETPHHDAADDEESEADNDNDDTVEDSPTTLNAMCILGKILERADRDAEAEQIYRHVLEGFTTHFGPDSHDALLAMSSLTRVLYEQKRYVEAHDMNVCAESGMLKLLGPDHPDTVVAKKNLSMVREKLNGTKT